LQFSACLLSSAGLTSQLLQTPILPSPSFPLQERVKSTVRLRHFMRYKWHNEGPCTFKKCWWQ
jgi:hypothetical protein